jgi:hypothetical protein
MLPGVRVFCFWSVALLRRDLIVNTFSGGVKLGFGRFLIQKKAKRGLAPNFGRLSRPPGAIALSNVFPN